MCKAQEIRGVSPRQQARWVYTLQDTASAWGEAVSWFSWRLEDLTDEERSNDGQENITGGADSHSDTGYSDGDSRSHSAEQRGTTRTYGSASA